VAAFEKMTAILSSSKEFAKTGQNSIKKAIQGPTGRISNFKV
jgi:hypothetical protein